MKDNEVRKPALALVEQVNSERQQTSIPLPPVIEEMGDYAKKAFRYDLEQSKRALEPAYRISKEIGDKTRKSVHKHLTSLAENLQAREELQKAA